VTEKDNRISLTELKEIFGEHMPSEALRILYETEMTHKSASDERLEEILGKLRQIAEDHNPLTLMKVELFECIQEWVHKHDLPHSQACAIIAAVVETRWASRSGDEPAYEDYEDREDRASGYEKRS
jgi:hypothetical protein